MPKKPIDYSKTVVYKIQHIDNDALLYVGHTTNFTKRKSQHKSNCYNETSKEYHYKVYEMMRANGGWDCFNMIELEKYPCNDKREAERRENELMKNLKSNMNTHINFIDDIIEYQKRYQQTHKDQKAIYNKRYRDKKSQSV
jgi:predicted GIY-YIG superfamily endonuclease